MSTRPNTHEMVVIHRIFRRELALLADLVRHAPAQDKARAADIAEHVEFMLTGLHHHHTTEDEYLWPILLDRARPHAELIRRMETQHKTVAQCSEQASSLVKAWRQAPVAAAREKLADVLAQLLVALEEHLDEEEAHILPLVRDTLTVAEWEELGKRGFDKFPRSAAPILLGLLLEVATVEEGRTFFRKLPLPVRVIWRLAGRRRYRDYIGRVRGGSLPSHVGQADSREVHS